MLQTKNGDGVTKRISASLASTNERKYKMVSTEQLIRDTKLAKKRILELKKEGLELKAAIRRIERRPG